MSTSVLVSKDFGWLELLKVRLQNLAVAPSSPAEGWAYYDTALHKARYWNGTTWAAFDGSDIPDGAVTSAKLLDGTIVNADISAGAAIALAKLATDPLARANHTGSQVAATISDLAGAVQAYRLDQFAAPNVDLNAGSHKITSLLDGVTATDAATLGQVQALTITGTNKTAVRAASVANHNLAAPGTIVGGVTMAAGDHFLAKNQTAGAENGLYVWNATSTPATRATDADVSAEVKSGLAVWIDEGTNADTRWVLTTVDPIVLGTTALVFVQDFAATATTAGPGLTATAGVLAVGQGVGIAVAVDAVAIDTAVVARKVTATLGNAALTSIPVAHNLGNQWVTAQCFRNSAPFDLVDCDVQLTDANTATFIFAVAPTAAQFRACISG